MHLVGFIVKKCVTMQHGHMNVKADVYVSCNVTITHLA